MEILDVVAVGALFVVYEVLIYHEDSGTVTFRAESAGLFQWVRCYNVFYRVFRCQIGSPVIFEGVGKKQGTSYVINIVENRYERIAG